MMNIQGYQKLTLLDFPGKVACTVFCGGCNLRCPFCHNAGLVVSPMEHPNAEEEVFDYLRKRRGLLEGVCITGGEPLLQPGLGEFAARVKDMGFAVKLDTNGSLPDRLRRIVDSGVIDYVAMDVKSSPAGYGRAIGSDMDPAIFEESISFLKSCGIHHEFRTTAVKGIHTVGDIEEAAKTVGEGEAYFIQRYVDSGMILGTGCAPFSEEEMGQLLSAARKYAPLTELRGISEE